MRQDETKNTDQEVTANPESGLPQGSAPSDSRRRFVARAAAAPVLLSVAGRSALATTNCQDIPKGLSPLAWLSVHPKKGGTACLSHSVGGNPLGKSPGYWTPNKNGKCFQGAWPNGVKPFTTCWRIKTTNPKTYQQVTWVAGNWSTYTNMLYYYPEGTLTDAGWNTGDKLSWLNDSRSISKILIDETAAQGLKWHFCCAYLNALTFPNYAITVDELKYLYENRKLAPSGYILTDSEIKAFLSQTWA